MKTLLQILFFLLLVSQTIFPQWYPQTSGTTWTLHGVSFTDSDNGTAVGVGGTILRTTDGGTNWASQTSGTNNELTDVSFTDSDNGTAVGVLGTILRTTDGGTTWTPQTSGTPNDLRGVSFTDSDNGTAVGMFGTILRTTDGGTNWTPQTSGTTTHAFEGVSFTDSDNGTAVGTIGILRTTDGGTTWTPQILPDPIEFYSGVSFTDSDNGTAVCYPGTILRTTDGGTNWIPQTSGTTAWLKRVSFTDSDKGTIVGLGPTLLRTTDGGATWISQISGTTIKLRGVSFIDSDIGTVVGGSSDGQEQIILRTTNGGGTFAFTTLTSEVMSGAQILEVASTDSFLIGDNIIINPGGESEELNKISGFGSVMLETPLLFNHQVGELVVHIILTTIEENRLDIPEGYALYNNFPNPFNPNTKIKYSVPILSKVVIKVFDVLGNEIAILVNEEKAMGDYEVEFNGSDLTSGIYLYQLRAGSYLQTRKMVLMK